jgi:hypothetical protein
VIVADVTLAKQADLQKHALMSTNTSIYNPTQGLVEKSKLAQHVYKESHKICWKEEKVLCTEPTTKYRK